MSKTGQLAIAAIAPIVWGTSYFVTARYMPDSGPLTIGAIRALPSGIVALLLTRQLPTGAWRWRSWVLGLLNIGIFLPLLAVAAYRLPGGVAGVFNALMPLFVLILGGMIAGEKARLIQVLASIVGIIGTAMVTFAGHIANDPLGVIAGIVAIISLATASLLVKRWKLPEGATPLTMTGWVLTAGGIVLTIAAAFVDGAPKIHGGSGWLAALWLAAITGFVAYLCFYYGLENLPATAVAPLSLLTPVVAAIIGLAVNHEDFTVIQYAGLVLAIIAIVLPQLRVGKQPTPQPQPPEIIREEVVELVEVGASH